MSENSPQIIGFEFEREVASIFRVLGAAVEHDVGIAGNQVDTAHFPSPVFGNGTT